MQLMQAQTRVDLEQCAPPEATWPIGELPVVMTVLARLLGADAIHLTMHPSDGPPVHVAAVGEEGSAARRAHGMHLADSLARRHHRPQAQWEAGAGPHDRCLLVLLAEVPGHSRLVLGLHFTDLHAEQARRAEAYVERQPFADGYFDIWQLSRLRARRCAELEEALNRTDDGLVLLGRNADILFENDTARALLDAGEGLRRQKGMLRATNLANSINLQMVIEHVIAAAVSGAQDEDSGQVLALRRRTGPPLLALVLPSRTQPLEPTDVAAAVHLADPKLDPGRALLPVCQVYGLSPVETTLVGHLAAGRTLGVAAQHMRIKEHTARSYLKNIFFKTSTNRQTEVVALMLSSLLHVKQSALRNYGFAGSPRRGGLAA